MFDLHCIRTKSLNQNNVDVSTSLKAGVANASMIVRTAVAKQRGGVVEELQNRKNDLARLVFWGQGNFHFFFFYICFLIYFLLVSAPVSLLHSNHILVFFYLPKFLTYFALELCCISRGSFWYYSVGSGSLTGIRDMLVSDRPTIKSFNLTCISYTKWHYYNLAKARI